jgi:nucleotide-binding universal stress UspA family protein
MPRIICCTDFSVAATRAGEAAAALAGGLGCTLELVHALELPSVPAGMRGSGAAPTALRRAIERELREQAAGLAGVSIATRVLTGQEDDAILACADEAQPAMLVLGTHGRRGARRLLLGSTAERVVRGAHCPVVVVHHAPSVSVREWTPSARPLRLVVGLNPSPAGDAAIAWVRRLRASVPCDVAFVHLFWPPRERARLHLPDDPARAYGGHDAIIAALERELDRRIADLPGTGKVELRVRAFADNGPAPLAWEAEVDDADLLVVGTTQRRHSHALGALRASCVPVLCVPVDSQPSPGFLVPSPRAPSPYSSILE